MATASIAPLGEVQAMRLHEQIPVLVLFENERDGVPDRDLERRDLAARGARPGGGTNTIDRAFEPAYQPLGSSAEAMGSDCAMAPCSHAPSAGRQVVIPGSQIECTDRPGR